MNEVKFPSDPTVVGPGVWYTIHRTGRLSTNERRKQQFVDLMNSLRDDGGFPCLKCRKHIGEYMDSHPFEPYWNLKDALGEDIGMFKWSWEFHNEVNRRLGKPYVSWDDALRIFTDGSFEVCSLGCGLEEHPAGQPATNSASQPAVQLSGQPASHSQSASQQLAPSRRIQGTVLTKTDLQNQTRYTPLRISHSDKSKSRSVAQFSNRIYY